MGDHESKRPTRRKIAPFALRLSCLLVWLALASVVIWLEIERRAGTLHPVFIPLLMLWGFAFVFAIVGISLAVGQLWRAREHWKQLSIWVVAILLPWLLFAAPFELARRSWRELQVPHDAAGRLVIMTAASLMEGQAACSYPRRLETGRLVMFYRDLARPEADGDAMERHVAQLEEKVGAPLRSKIHWVRGKLLGQGNCSFLGLALGSASSPADWSGPQGYLDRHELAHAVIVQQRPVGADPPMVLHEGWAESQSGLTSLELAQRALKERSNVPNVLVKDLFSPEFYHWEGGQVYTIGGAFVDYLLRQHGATKFVALYNRCQPHTFEADFKAVYGQSLTDLETSFWQDARAAIQQNAPVAQGIEQRFPKP